MKKNILSYSYSSFLKDFKIISGRGEYFTKPVYRQLMKQGYFQPATLSCFKKSPKILKLLTDNYELCALNLTKTISAEGTEKLIFLTQDNLKIESVIIPMKTYYTLCISSQIGCKMNCSFCQTGTKGKIRDLKTAEIIAQLFYAKLTYGFPIRNVVFMGMGEPLDNMDNVLEAIEIMTDDHGFNLKSNHITLSTSGLGNKLKSFLQLKPKCVIALSLNASNNETRTQLMPVNKAYPIEDLIELFRDYCNAGQTLFVEYVLIDNINDSLEDADNLYDLLKGLKVRINLIPLNPPINSDMKAPSENKFEAFYQRLRTKKLHVIRRTSKGDSIKAACGQLGEKIRSDIPTVLKGWQ